MTVMNGNYSSTLEKTSLKAVLLHNGNVEPSIPIAHVVNVKEKYYEAMKTCLEAINYSEPGVGNPWHTYTFYPARERGLRNEILPLSNEKNNILQVAVSLDEGLEISSLLIMFLLTIRQLQQKL